MGRGMSEWQPIETAPKDGRWIIVYRPSGKISPLLTVPRIGCDRWGSDLWGEGWTQSASAIQPTHWQPLTPPTGAP